MVVTGRTPTADLLSRAYQGEQDAFDQLYRTHNKQLLLLLYRLTRDHHAAEDLMQETFLQCFQKIKDGYEIKRFIPWMFRVARNLALNSNIALTVRRSTEREFRAAMETHTVQENGKWILSEDVLRGLKPLQREILSRKYVSDETLPHIAEQLGMHKNTVQTQLTRAQDVIRRRRVEGELP